MKMLNATECAKWCTERGITDANRRRLQFAGGGKQEFDIPLPAVGLKIIALSLVLTQEPSGEHHPRSLLWLVESGIWSESFETAGKRQWDLLLVGSGSPRTSVESVSGLIFEEDERVDESVFLTTVMLYQWDAVLVPDHGRYAVQINHDGYVRLSARDASAAHELSAIAAAWKSK